MRVDTRCLPLCWSSLRDQILRHDACKAFHLAGTAGSSAGFHSSTDVAGRKSHWEALAKQVILDHVGRLKARGWNETSTRATRLQSPGDRLPDPLIHLVCPGYTSQCMQQQAASFRQGGHPPAGEEGDQSPASIYTGEQMLWMRWVYNLVQAHKFGSAEWSLAGSSH